MVGLMDRFQRGHHKSAIVIVEEALHLLRSSPIRLLTSFYLGSIPFVLGLLYFWADMSRSAKAHEYNTVAALGLTILFVWMKYWHFVFALRVRMLLTGNAEYTWSMSRVASIVATQTLIHSTRFFIMPIAALMVVPFGFCYAFFQNASAHVNADDQSIKSTITWAWRQAKIWPRQNHLLIGIFWIFGFAVFLNVSFASFVIPQLLKTLFGIESKFTLSGIHIILNPIFWVSMLAITYLLLDPFVKTAYVLRCFYGTSLESGEDLMTELNHLINLAKVGASGLLFIFLFCTPLTADADSQVQISSKELNRSIEDVMNRREFAWRMPRDSLQNEKQESKGPIAAAVDWIFDLLVKGVKTIKNWITKFYEWLEALLPAAEKTQKSSDADWMTSVRLILIVLLILLLTSLTFVFVRIWKKRRTEPSKYPVARALQLPDLADETIKADDLPANRWLALAKEMIENGDLRLAMRALYLATLARLAEKDMITIELHKSNRDYEKELIRRVHEKREMLAIFSKSLTTFERFWYGMYKITRSDVDNFAANQERLLAVAEK